MTLGEDIGAGASVTKLLLNLNGNSNDSSGNSNNGIVDNAITFSQDNGRYGQGAGVNGTSSYIKMTNSVDVSGPFTMVAWINTTRSNVNQEIVGHAFYVSPSNFTAHEFRLISTGKIQYTEATETTSTGYDVAGATTIPTNTWFLAGVTMDSSRVCSIYFNGKLDGSATFNSPRIAMETEELNAFALPPFFGGRSNFLSGKGDKIRIDNRCWTASEMKKYFTYNKGRFGII